MAEMQVQIPAWFQAAMVLLFGKYDKPLSRGAVLGYWDELSDLPEEAVARAMKQAPSRLSDKEGTKAFCPSAPFVREVAVSIAKTLGPKPDFSRPQLEEPAPEVSPEWSARFDEIRRTKQGSERSAALMRLVLDELEREEERPEKYQRCDAVGPHERRCSGPRGHDAAHRSGRFEWTDDAEELERKGVVP
jgi:hypothetical protein